MNLKRFEVAYYVDKKFVVSTVKVLESGADCLIQNDAGKSIVTSQFNLFRTERAAEKAALTRAAASLSGETGGPYFTK